MQSPSLEAPEIPVPERYSLDSLLHEGVSASVYRGKETATANEIVLKFFDPAAQSGYLREMAAAFGIEHPNLPRCLDTFHLPDGRACMVYEFVSGGTLTRWLGDHQRADPEVLFACLRDILNALDYLHGLGRIHCDIKPDNVFLKPTAAGLPQFILADLGAVCFVREARELRHKVGTPAYIAPERLYERFHFNSDLYSVGVLAFELWTGHRPFEGNPEQLARAHLTQQVPIHEIDDASWQAFIESLLEKDPAQRLQTPQMALTMLERIWAQTTIRRPGLSLPISSSSGATLKQLGSGSLHEHSQIPLANRPSAMLLFSLQERPLLGLDFNSHIELLGSSQKSHGKYILKSGPAQSLGVDQLVYTTGSRIMKMDLRTKASTSLRNDCRGIKAFYADPDRLLWFDRYGGHYHNLAEDSHLTFRFPQYLMQPQACFLSEGRFCVSEGSANQDIVVRDTEAQPVCRWRLNGPVLALAGNETVVIALTLGVQAKQEYCLWRVSIGQNSADQVLTEHPLSWCGTPGHLFWLTPDHELFALDTEDEPEAWASLPKGTETIVVSSDHQYIATLGTEAAGNLDLRIWHNQLETLS
jgi:serine/threonine protein kinase